MFYYLINLKPKPQNKQTDKEQKLKKKKNSV